MLQQPPLRVQSPTKARQLTLRSHNPVARDDDRNRILAVGEADGARRELVAELLGERAVARGRAVRDLAQGVPHTMLECRTKRLERQVEGRPRAREILLELLPRAGENVSGRPRMR